jgi:hypothetical protein
MWAENLVEAATTVEKRHMTGRFDFNFVGVNGGLQPLQRIRCYGVRRHLWHVEWYKAVQSRAHPKRASVLQSS